MRGEQEMVNSKSEEDDDENEWVGDGGRVWDFWSSFFLPIFWLHNISESYRGGVIWDIEVLVVVRLARSRERERFVMSWWI